MIKPQNTPALLLLSPVDVNLTWQW